MIALFSDWLNKNNETFIYSHVMIKGFTYFLLLCNIAEEESAYFVHKMKETLRT